MLNYSKSILSILLLFGSFLTARTQITFLKTYGGAANDFGAKILALDNGYLIAGNIRTGGESFSGDGYILRIDSLGEVMWQKTYNSGHKELFHHITLANDGGFLVVGDIRNLTTFFNDILVMKLDDNGEVIWSKLIGATFNSEFINQSNDCGFIKMSDGYIFSGVLQGGDDGTDYNGTYIVRLQNTGDVKWANRYSPGIGSLTVSHAEEDTLYVSGRRQDSTDFVRLNAKTGETYDLLHITNGVDSYSDLCCITAAGDGNLMIGGTVNPPSPALNRKWLIKTRKDGSVLWSKLFSKQNSSWSGPILPLPQGGVLLTLSSPNTGQATSADLLKVNLDGEIQWAYSYGKTDISTFTHTAITPDGGFVAVGYTKKNSSSNFDILVVKMDSLGRVGNCCDQPLTEIVEEDFPTTSTPGMLNAISDISELAWAPVVQPSNFVTSLFCPPPPQIPVLELGPDILLCPDSTITFDVGAGFLSYQWQDGSATSNFTAKQSGVYWVEVSDNCEMVQRDSVVVDVVALPQPSNVTIQCPFNISVTVPADINLIAVNYNPPTWATDCPCGDINSSLVQGFSNGGNFPVGTTQVCYQATDDCSNSQSCCFTVTVEKEPADEEPCDVKNTPCIKFEIMGIFQNPAKQKTYRMRVTNNCANKLEYVAFQLPDAFTAIKPADNTTYNAPSGRSYLVRNPNYSPFRSIRFKTTGVGISGGQSDIFEYTLPAQTSPTFIHAIVRLEPQTYYETHLNVFACEVQQTPNRPEDAGEDRYDLSTANSGLRVFPNPGTNAISVDFSAWEAHAQRLRIFDPFGRLLFDQKPDVRAELYHIDLPVEWPVGVYFLEASTETGEQTTLRFVKNR